jgi:hypothetical protein
MIRYIPFLKLKSNEIMALKELDEETKEIFVPFFDYAKRDDSPDNNRPLKKGAKEKTPEEKFKDTVIRLFKSLKKNAIFLDGFYLDNFDLPENFVVDGNHNYRYLLSNFSKLPVIPVVGIDRNQAHLNAVIELKEAGDLISEVIAFRITEEDFEDYDAVEDEISNQLTEVFDLFESVDLVLDCRVCANSDPLAIAGQIVDFINSFTDDYNVRRIIVTGSSLPASIADVAAVSTEEIINRVEVEIYTHVITGLDFEFDVIFGDYATVSPNYSDSDIPKYAIRNVTAPKIIYTFNDSQFIKRGSALATHPLGNGQYELLLEELVEKPFFRTDNSWGDRYLVEKSNGEGSDATPGTMVKPLCNSHITYICQQLNEI